MKNFTVTQDLIEKQADLEARMQGYGASQVRREAARAVERKTESETRYGSALVSHNTLKVADAIAEFVKETGTGKAGRRHAAVKYLKDVKPSVAAMIALRCIMDGVSSCRLIQSVAINIGTRIEDEARYRAFEAQDKKLYKNAKKKARKGTTYTHRKYTMTRYMKVNEIDFKPWPQTDKLHIGMKLIETVIEKTGLVQQDRVNTGNKKTNIYLTTTTKTTEWIKSKQARCEEMTPMFLPTIIPPRDWTPPSDGGYFTTAVPPLSLIKSHNKHYLEELEERVEEMLMVYETVNALQQTAWMINQPVLNVMRHVWDNGFSYAKVPSREDTEICECPKCGQYVQLGRNSKHVCFNNDPETHKAWKKKAAITHEANTKLKSKRIQFEGTLWTAGIFEGGDPLFMVYQLDFRGRVYTVNTCLSPQGNDQSKALLTFHEGKAVEDGVVAGWLAIHGANVYGYDKASLEDRIGWIEERAELIKATAADPFADLWWTEADKPWQFLAFCYEWAGFMEQGFGFVSHLPVALDGSCSGIQHFSAMLRDHVGGAAVNLLPAEVPSDIYKRVADVVLEKLRADMCHKAYVLLDLGINRKSTKRQVMTLPYGATMYSCREYTEAWMKEALADKFKADPGYHFEYARFEEGQIVTGDGWFDILTYLSDLIWKSISEVVVAARDAMDWLKECAKVVAGEGLPITWTTPVGLPIMQQYFNMKSRRVETKLGDVRVTLSIRQELDTIDKKRMKSSVSPNFVHSMDASHLMWSVSYALDNDIKSFAMIHDSFGTHAANTPMLAACLRHAFVDMYEENDVLVDFKASMEALLPPERAKELPGLPETGGLDLETVKQSDFFFA